MSILRTRKLTIPLSLAALAVVALFLWNHLALQVPLLRVVNADPRNVGIEARAHFGSYVAPNVLVFDLRTVSGQKSPADVFRLLLQFASEVKGEEFAVVQLAHRGDTKFLLDGQYFKQLGVEYGEQNPVYTMRTFPQHLLLPDGEKAYPTWEGGWLGVTGKQLEDFGAFHEAWYISDLASE